MFRGRQDGLNTGHNRIRTGKGEKPCRGWGNAMRTWRRCAGCMYVYTPVCVSRLSFRMAIGWRDVYGFYQKESEGLDICYLF